MPSLDFYDGDRLLFRVPLGPGRLILGRSDACDIALDGEGISRRHVMFEPRNGEWWAVDRSRNGTFINGELIERAPLTDADLISVGPYVARFASERRAKGTTTRIVPRMLWHEEPIQVGRDGLTVANATLEFVRGPRAGDSVTLTGPRTSLGSGPKDQVTLTDLPPAALVVRVIRGRVMVEPSAVPVQVAGGPLPAVMPVHEHEEVTIGKHGFVVRTEFNEVTDDRASFGQLVGATPVMRRMFGALSRIAAHDHPVLLVGESGTGKELAAQALHHEGPRSKFPFVAVNCAALPDSLLESELFGHEKGAFTGATDRQEGAFQRATGGTLFLDEIGELKLEAQAKLLRALESGEVRRVGGAEPEFPDVRIVAATNRDLSQMIADGLFRDDLFFRLSVLSIRMPPLRERLDDIAELASAIVDRTLPGATLTEGAMGRLADHQWPGNVRELRNVLTRAFVMGGPVIEAEALTFANLPADSSMVVFDPGPAERRTIQEALARAGGNRSVASRILGIPRSSLLYRMKKWGIA